MNCYERQRKLKSKGIKTLLTSGISTGYDTVNGVKQPLIIFSDREVAERYTRRLQVAGDRNNLAPRLWNRGARRTAARLLREIMEAREEMKGLPEV